MSNVLRNDLWMVMIAWSLFLCGYRFVSLIALTLITVYLYSFAEMEDGFRTVLFFSLNIVLSCFGLLALGFGVLRFVFVVIASINCALLDGYLRTNDDNDLTGACVIGTLMFVSFMITSLFLSFKFVLVTLMIFGPYLSTMFLKVFEKEQKIPFCSYNIRA